MTSPRFLSAIALASVCTVACAAYAQTTETAAAGSWGGNVRAEPDRTSEKLGTLANGDPITIVERTAAIWNGYPWFRIRMPNGKPGYQWGGIICGFDRPIAGTFGTCERDNRKSRIAATASPKADAATANGSPRRDCYLRVDGKTYVDGRCWVYPLGQGTYTLNVRGHGPVPSPHFAQITSLVGGHFEATWNADPNDLHAWDKLGEVTRANDGCWVNDRVRMCAR